MFPIEVNDKLDGLLKDLKILELDFKEHKIAKDFYLTEKRKLEEDLTIYSVMYALLNDDI